MVVVVVVEEVVVVVVEVGVHMGLGRVQPS